MVKGVYCVLVLIILVGRSSAYDVIYAVNCGGRELVDSSGIEYEEDSTGLQGYTSNHGARYAISRVPSEDAPLYQTERYATRSFSYTIPLNGEGKYLLVLKFSEVFFEAANQKVFDISLNDMMPPVISELDIFLQVGHATAHDEYIPFTVSRGKLFVRDGVSELRGGRLKVTFLKGQQDNPKINAIVLVKGADVNEFPRLPPLTATHGRSTKPTQNQAPVPSQLNLDDFEPSSTDTTDDEPKNRRTSGPRQPDPYAVMDNSSLITILCIVVATIIPIVILRCRL